jgi:hypothetical protein
MVRLGHDGRVGTGPFEVFRALDDGAPDTPPTVRPGFDAVIATDIWKRWGAVYSWTVTRDEEIFTQIQLAQRRSDGSWQQMSSGGTHGLLAMPWEPTVRQDSRLSPGELAGQDVEDTDGTEIELVARSGFAAHDVRDVAVSYGGEPRMVSVVPYLNAFVILGPRGDWTLQAVGESGALAEAIMVDCH